MTRQAGIAARYSRRRTRASQHSVSAEEDARQVVAGAVVAPERVGELAVRLFGPDHGVDLKFEQKRPHEPLDFGAPAVD